MIEAYLRENKMFVDYSEVNLGHPKYFIPYAYCHISYCITYASL